jgi:hypothetical protein
VGSICGYDRVKRNSRSFLTATGKVLVRETLMRVEGGRN